MPPSKLESTLFSIRRDFLPTFAANVVEIAFVSSSVNGRMEVTFASAIPLSHLLIQ